MKRAGTCCSKAQRSQNHQSDNKRDSTQTAKSNKYQDVGACLSFLANVHSFEALYAFVGPSQQHILHPNHLQSQEESWYLLLQKTQFLCLALPILPSYYSCEANWPTFWTSLTTDSVAKQQNTCTVDPQCLVFCHNRDPRMSQYQPGTRFRLATFHCHQVLPPSNLVVSS